MTAVDVHTPTRRRVLPLGANGSLWSARPSYGVFVFRGRRLRIEVTNPDDVLFPTDCGLSLLAALQHEDAPELTGRTVLDIGCGSGLYTVALLASGASKVTALDINPASAEATTANVRYNDLDTERLSCVTTDIADYAPSTRFDLVVTNLPHLPYDPDYATANGLEAALVGGPDGREIYDLVLGRIDDLLAPGGTLLMAHSSLTDIERTKTELAQRGYLGRELEVCEMDIPLLSYAEHKATMLGHLQRLREQGSATFVGERFTVHALAFQRTASTPQH